MNGRRLSLFWLTVFLPAWAACGGESLTLPSEGRPAQIEVVGGNDQTAPVSTELPTQLVVKVTDSQDRPVQGVTVEFALDEAVGGSVTESAVTDTAGKAVATVTLGPRVGPVTGAAWVSGEDELATEFRATAFSSDANRISAVSGDGQVGPVGSPLGAPLIVQVTDQFDNPIPGVPVSWSITGGGSISESSTITDANGQTAVQRTLGTTAGLQTTLATAEGLAGSPVTFNHTATAGNAARVVIVSGTSQQGLPGAQLPEELVVQVLDAENNPIQGRAVAWVVGTGGGSASPETSPTNEQGRAGTRWTLGDAPGRNTLSAVVSGVGVALFEATATKASSSIRIVAHEPEPSVVGQAVEVRVEVTGSGATPTGSVSVTSPGASSCSITLASGTGSCSLTFNSAGDHQITATYSGDARFNGSTDSETHRVEAENAAPTAAFSPPSCTAGQPCQFSDGSSDSDGNVVAWIWEFGDGGSATDRNPEHVYATPGTYNVRLIVRDDDGASSEVTHAVNVSAPANAPPVAAPDSYQTPAGQPLDVQAPGVLANDSDPEGANLTARLVDGPQQGGLVSLNPDGSFSYFPGTAQSGTQDSFTYAVSDGILESTTTVTVSIQ